METIKVVGVIDNFLTLDVLQVWAVFYWTRKYLIARAIVIVLLTGGSDGWPIFYLVFSQTYYWDEYFFFAFESYSSFYGDVCS